jgi:hypothetical protein
MTLKNLHSTNLQGLQPGPYPNPSSTPTNQRRMVKETQKRNSPRIVIQYPTRRGSCGMDRTRNQRTYGNRKEV